MPVSPLCEVKLPPGSRVRCLAPLNIRTWLVVDDSSGLLRIDVPPDVTDAGRYSICRLLVCTAGAVAGLCVLAGCSIAVTATADGSICARNYMSGSILQACRFSAPATCMATLPPPDGGDAPCSGARRFAVGFRDGSACVVQRCGDGWALLAALKPHAAAVTAIAVAPGASHTATVAADGTVFFFSTTSVASRANSGCVGGSSGGDSSRRDSNRGSFSTSSGHGSSVDWTPLGFCTLSSRGSGSNVDSSTGSGGSAACRPACADWAPDGSCLVVGCEGGELTQVHLPTEDADTTRSYALQLPMRKAVFVAGLSTRVPSQAPVLQHQNEESSGSCTSPEVERLPVTWLRCKQAGSSTAQILVCLGGSGAGQLWCCNLASEVVAPAGPVVPAPAVTTSGCASPPPHCQLWGASNGSVRLQVVGNNEVSPTTCWQGVLHHAQGGSVTSVAVAWDGSCFLSGAANGSLVAFRNRLDNRPPPPPQTVAEAGSAAGAMSGQADTAVASVHSGLLSLAALAGCEVLDNVPGAPSLEQGKAAAVADAVASQAAGKRAGLAAHFSKVRAEFAQLVAANAAVPSVHQLPLAAFHVDQGLDALLAAEHMAKMQEAHGLAASDAAAAAALLGKLTTFFAPTGDLSVMPLGGCSPAVGSLGLPQLPPEVQAEVDQLLAATASEQSGRTGALLRGSHPAPGSTQARRAPGASVVINTDSSSADGGSGEGSGGGGEGVGSGACQQPSARAAERTAARRARDAAWSAMLRSKPGDDYESAEDAAALAEAAATVGDLKLRGTLGFVPDEDHRETPATKRLQMAKRAVSMRAACVTFDARLRALQADRDEVLRHFTSLSTRATDISAALGLPAASSTAFMHVKGEASAVPITSVSKAELQAKIFQKLADKQRRAGGLGNFAEGVSTGNGDGSGSTAGSMLPACAVTMRSPGSEALPSAHDGSQKRWLMAELQALEAQSQAATEAFNEALAAAARERAALEADILACAARQLVAYQELLLLKDCEQQEVMLSARITAKQDEVDELAGRAAQLQEQVDLKRGEGDSIAAACAAVVAEFEAYVADKAPHVEALTSAFHRRIKRARNRGGGPGAVGSDADSADISVLSDSDGDTSASDYDDADDSGPEVCPPGCEQPVYDRIVELRDARLDEESAAADVARALEGLRKDLELLGRKRRSVDATLAAINQEVLAFQQDKQARLNQIEVEVVLRAHQLHLHCAGAKGDDGDGGAPAPALGGETLASALVISRVALSALQLRMQGLDDEQAVLHVAQRDLRRQRATLQTEAAALEAGLADQKARCRDVQLLKFGREIDVSLLDTLGRRNTAADELRAALQEQERKQVRELAALDVAAGAKARELLAATRANTAVLNAVSDLSVGQRATEAALAAQRGGLFADGIDARCAAVEERHALVAGVNQRAATLQQLNARIAVLRRKDGVLAL